MFDIGFWELTIIVLVGLLVLGPERLPAAARTAGLWVRKARRFISTTTAEIERELNLEELKRQQQKEIAAFKQGLRLEEEALLDTSTEDARPAAQAKPAASSTDASPASDSKQS
jgi:sec-independent protein translocase protein TatB